MFGLSNLALYAILAGILAVTSFGAGWKANGWKHDSEYLARMEGGRIALEKTAEAIAKIDITHQTIYQKVQTNVIEKPVYRECKHDPDTFRLLNDSLTNGKQSIDKGKLPGESGSFVGRFLRGNDSEDSGNE